MANPKDCDECMDVVPVSTRMVEFFSQTHKYSLEWRMLRYTGVSIIMLLALLTLFSLSVLDGATFITKYGWWLFYLVVTIVFSFASLWHINIHNRQVNSMLGMMMGMTLGMQAGVMLSVVIGSTNGMFMGSLFGMLFGLVVGIYAGKCCGMMGILQGAMAGVMGGTMGPMIALMMKTDHILWFMPPFMLINILLLVGLSFLVYEELVEKNKVEKKEPADFWTFFSVCLITTMVFTVIIVYGYKSAFVA